MAIEKSKLFSLRDPRLIRPLAAAGVGPQAHPARFLNGSQTDPERIPNGIVDGAQPGRATKTTKEDELPNAKKLREQKKHLRPA